MKIKACELAMLSGKNPGEYNGRRFESLNGVFVSCNGTKFSKCMIKRDGTISDIDGKYVLYFSQFTTVDEIQEPVDFATALNSGKLIKPENCDFFREYQSVYRTLTLFAVLPHYLELAKGKWYIEP